MLKRTISGAFYVAVLVAFFCLRQFVDAMLFNVLTGFFIVVGTMELARALKTRIYKWALVASIIYAIFFVPAYMVGQYWIFTGIGGFACLLLAIFMLFLVTLYSLIKDQEMTNYWWSCLLFVYPALLLLTMLLANEIELGFIALLLAFAISPCSDTFAYLVGSLFKGKKLCPKLSPKKTWSGAIGGTIGGVVASIVVYLIFKPEVAFSSPLVLFAVIGLVASILNICGDLFESYIKRKVDIKDMGKIMPGHGGVLDRIDGTMFVIVFLYIVFLFV